MLTVKQAAERLGLSEKTVYAMIARGEIPGYKFKKAVRVEEADLEAYKASKRIRPAPAEPKQDIRTVRKNRTQRQRDQEQAGYTGLSCLSRFQKA